MGGGGSRSSAESTSIPQWTGDVQGLRQSLLGPVQERAGQESPYFSLLSNMYQGLLQNQSVPGADPYAKRALEGAVTTGLPMTPQAFGEAAIPYYMGAYPAYQNQLDQSLAQAKESSGMTGNLRGTAGYEALGQGAASTTADFMKYLTEQAGGAYQAQAGRQMQAIPTALSSSLNESLMQAQFPLQQFQTMLGLAPQIAESQYPWLTTALQMATAQPSVPTTISRQGSMGIQLPNPSICCWTFLEGELLTDCVRRYRDEHFSKTGLVSQGYRRMSGVLVPAMKRNKTIKWLVKKLMLQPMSDFAEFHYRGELKQLVYWPISYFWVGVWRLLGGIK